tara:strand:+ start:106 stop:441 length:336 start_codon:yes stop_codon:yes gene_type:complete
MSQIPPEFSMLMELVENMTPTLEEELRMETEIRTVNASQDIDYLKRYAEAMTRQNHEQSRFIAGCLKEIHSLKAELACATSVKKKTNLLERILGLLLKIKEKHETSRSYVS